MAGAEINRNLPRLGNEPESAGRLRESRVIKAAAVSASKATLDTATGIIKTAVGAVLNESPMLAATVKMFTNIGNKASAEYKKLSSLDKKAADAAAKAADKEAKDKERAEKQLAATKRAAERAEATAKAKEAKDAKRADDAKKVAEQAIKTTDRSGKATVEAANTGNKERRQYQRKNEGIFSKMLTELSQIKTIVSGQYRLDTKDARAAARDRLKRFTSKGAAPAAPAIKQAQGPLDWLGSVFSSVAGSAITGIAAGMIGSITTMLLGGIIAGMKSLMNPKVMMKILGKAGIVGLIVTAAMGLFESITEGYKTWLATGSVYDTIVAAAGGLINVLSFGLISAEDVKAFGAEMKPKVQAVIDTVASFFNFEWVKDSLDWMTRFASSVKITYVDPLMDSMKYIFGFSWVSPYIINVQTWVLHAYDNYAMPVVRAIKSIFSFDWIASQMRSTMQWVTDAYDTYAKPVIDNIKAIFSFDWFPTLDDIGGYAKSIGDKIVDFFMEIVGGVRSYSINTLLSSGAVGRQIARQFMTEDEVKRLDQFEEKKQLDLARTTGLRDSFNRGAIINRELEMMQAQFAKIAEKEAAGKKLSGWELSQQQRLEDAITKRASNKDLQRFAEMVGKYGSEKEAREQLTKETEAQTEEIEKQTFRIDYGLTKNPPYLKLLLAQATKDSPEYHGSVYEAQIILLEKMLEFFEDKFGADRNTVASNVLATQSEVRLGARAEGKLPPLPSADGAAAAMRSGTGAIGRGMGYKGGGRSMLDSARKNPEIVDTIVSEAKAAGIDPSYALQMAYRESAFNPSVKAGTSSATGLYQFIDGTWMGMLGKYGDRVGLDQSMMEKIRSKKLSAEERSNLLEMRKDPTANSRMGMMYTQENSNVLKRLLGRDPTSGELYMAHFMGAGGASKILSMAMKNPDVDATSAFPKEAAANKSIFGGRTVKQVIDLMSGKVSGNIDIDKLAKSPLPDAVAKASTDVVEARDDARSSSAAPVVVPVPTGDTGSGKQPTATHTGLAPVRNTDPYWQVANRNTHMFAILA